MGKARGETSPSADKTPAAARLHVWQVQAVRDVLFVGAVFGILWVGHALRAVTVPLLVALLLAYLFEPIIDRLCRHPRVKRPIAVGGLVAGAGLGALVLIALALPLVVSQTGQLIGDIRDGVFRSRIAALESYVPGTLRDEFRQFVDALPGPGTAAAGQGEDDGASEEAGIEGDGSTGPLTEAKVRAIVDERLAAHREGSRSAGGSEDGLGTSGWRDLAQDFRRSAGAVVGIIGGVVQVGLLVFLIPFYFFFFSLWYPAVVKFGRDLIPQKNRVHSLELLSKMDRVIAGFVRGRIVISLIMGILLAIGWMICGVPYAIVLGLVVGIFCAVPYLGVIGVPVAVGFLFFEKFGDPANSDQWWVWVLVWPTVVFAVVQLIEGYVLTPMIAGKATGLDPVTILVAVLAGGSVLGIYGMILAIPLAACGKILFTDVLLPKIHAWTRGEIADPLPIDRA